MNTMSFNDNLQSGNMYPLSVIEIGMVQYYLGQPSMFCFYIVEFRPPTPEIPLCVYIRVEKNSGIQSLFALK